MYTTLRRWRAALLLKWARARTSLPVSRGTFDALVDVHAIAHRDNMRLTDERNSYRFAARELQRETDEQLWPLLNRLTTLTAFNRDNRGGVVAYCMEIDTRMLVDIQRNPTARRYLARQLAHYTERMVVDAVIVPAPPMPRTYDNERSRWIVSGQ